LVGSSAEALQAVYGSDAQMSCPFLTIFAGRDFR
jgi:hypothetical protein